MVKKGTKKPPKLATFDPFPLIDKALRKQTKEELIAILLKIAKEHAEIARRIGKPVQHRKAGGFARCRSLLRHRSHH